MSYFLLKSIWVLILNEKLVGILILDKAFLYSNEIFQTQLGKIQF